MTNHDIYLLNEDPPKVTLHNEKNTDEEGIELKGTMKSYSESDQTSVLARAGTVSKIFGNAGRFISAIGDLIFGGIRK